MFTHSVRREVFMCRVSERGPNEAFPTELMKTGTYLINTNEGNKTISSGAKAQFLPQLSVGAEAPTPGALIYEIAPNVNYLAPTFRRASA